MVHPSRVGLILMDRHALLLFVMCGVEAQNREYCSLYQPKTLASVRLARTRSILPCKEEYHKFETDAKKVHVFSTRSNSYLPDEGLHRDHVGGGPRARPGHCTSAGLTPAIIPNADNSVVQFLLVGTAFALSLSCHFKIGGQEREHECSERWGGAGLASFGQNDNGLQGLWLFIMNACCAE